jgi:AcrR family transcriptional regulator
MRSTKAELLDAGIRLYGSMSGDLLNGMTVRAVTREAGFHRQTFYRYWSTQAEFVQDLIVHVVDPKRAPVADRVADEARRRASVSARLEDVVESIARHEFVKLATDPLAPVRMGLLMMNELTTPMMRELTQSYYDRAMASLADAIGFGLEQWGRRPVPGLTTKELARMCQAMLSGLVVHAKAAIDEPPAEDLLVIALQGLFDTFTEPVPDPARAASSADDPPS